MIIISIAHMDAKDISISGLCDTDHVIIRVNVAFLDLPTLSQGAETWFQHPPILLRVRLWPTQAGHCQKGQ